MRLLLEIVVDFPCILNIDRSEFGLYKLCLSFQDVPFRVTLFVDNLG